MALTGVACYRVEACALSRACLPDALVNISLAVGSTETRRATAFGGAVDQRALAAAAAGRFVAFRRVHLAVSPSERGFALAVIVSNLVDTVATERARLARTLIDIDLAVFASKAGWACAPKIADQIGAFAVVPARSGCAVVNILLAVFAGPTGWAGAVVVID